MTVKITTDKNTGNIVYESYYQRSTECYSIHNNTEWTSDHFEILEHRPTRSTVIYRVRFPSPFRSDQKMVEGWITAGELIKLLVENVVVNGVVRDVKLTFAKRGSITTIRYLGKSPV